MKMYKDRIKQWGLDNKNFKESEAMAVIRKKRQRDAIGKSSVFQIRGRDVDFKNLGRYFKRKHLSTNDIGTQSASSAPTPPGLVCFTPPHGPASPRISEIPAVRDLHSAATPFGLTSLTPQRVPTSPSTPIIFAVPEYMLFDIKNYVVGSFEAGTWISSNDAEDCISTKYQREDTEDTNLVNSICRRHLTACDLFDNGFFVEARLVLGQTSRDMEEILLMEHPHAMNVFLETILLVLRRSRPEVLRIMLRHFAGLAGTILPAMHPLGHFFKQAVLLDLIQLEAVAGVVLRGMADELARLLDPMHSTTLDYRLTELAWVKDDDCEVVETKLRALLRDCESMCGDYNLRTFRILADLAFLFSRQDRYTDMEEMGRTLVTRASQVSPYHYANDVKYLGLETVALALYGQGKTEMAVAKLREAIDVIVNTWDWTHPNILGYLVNSEGWLTELGQYDKAAEVRDERQSLIASMEALRAE